MWIEEKSSTKANSKHGSGQALSESIDRMPREEGWGWNPVEYHYLALEQNWELATSWEKIRKIMWFERKWKRVLRY